MANKKTGYGKKEMQKLDAIWAKRKIADPGKLRALYCAGWNVKQIADEFAVTEETVVSTLRRCGIA